MRDFYQENAPSWEEAMMIDMIRSMRKDRNKLLRSQGVKGARRDADDDDDLE